MIACSYILLKNNGVRADGCLCALKPPGHSQQPPWGLGAAWFCQGPVGDVSAVKSRWIFGRSLGHAAGSGSYPDGVVGCVWDDSLARCMHTQALELLIIPWKAPLPQELPQQLQVAPASETGKSNRPNQTCHKRDSHPTRLLLTNLASSPHQDLSKKPTQFNL